MTIRIILLLKYWLGLEEKFYLRLARKVFSRINLAFFRNESFLHRLKMSGSPERFANQVCFWLIGWTGTPCWHRNSVVCYLSKLRRSKDLFSWLPPRSFTCVLLASRITFIDPLTWVLWKIEICKGDSSEQVVHAIRPNHAVHLSLIKLQGHTLPWHASK